MKYSKKQMLFSKEMLHAFDIWLKKYLTIILVRLICYQLNSSVWNSFVNSNESFSLTVHKTCDAHKLIHVNECFHWQIAKFKIFYDPIFVTPRRYDDDVDIHKVRMYKCFHSLTFFVFLNISDTHLYMTN